ncbi:MAG: N-acetylmuramoyl-L-alanine amidase [Clostridiales bacterium]|nr:N-acetylmuramoyl-L-alanine amidase [Clostridiales bacterium]
MMDILIDSGHGGTPKDSGAIGPTGLREADAALTIANRVGAMLIEAGVNVGFTRTTDVNMSLQARSNMANRVKARYFLSIHINSATNPRATGTETFAFRSGGEGEKLANAVQRNLVSAIRLPDRGVKFANFHVLRETTMPAALVEVCFINNPQEEALLRKAEFIESAAQGIAAGAMEFLGVRDPIVLPPSETVPVGHWAEPYFDFLNSNGVQVHERRFNDSITRGEAIALLARATQRFMDA